MAHVFYRFILTSRAHIATLFAGVVMAVIISGCSICPLPQPGLSENVMAYFKDPKQAVVSIKSMLLSSDWAGLASYYDLRDTDDLDRASLVSGDFFVRKKRPEVSHPAGFWKYKRPFPPQFSYLSHRSISDGIVEVTVHIEIDEGGGMIQRGMQTFQLQKSPQGYQLLPTSPGPLASPVPSEMTEEFPQPLSPPVWQK